MIPLPFMRWRCAICGCSYEEAQEKRWRLRELPFLRPDRDRLLARIPAGAEGRDAAPMGAAATLCQEGTAAKAPHDALDVAEPHARRAVVARALETAPTPELREPVKGQRSRRERKKRSARPYALLVEDVMAIAALRRSMFLPRFRDASV